MIFNKIYWSFKTYRLFLHMFLMIKHQLKAGKLRVKLISLYIGCNELKNNTPVFQIKYRLFRKLPSTSNVTKSRLNFCSPHIKVCRFLKHRAIIKNPRTVLQKKLHAFSLVLIKNLCNKASFCVNPKTNSHFTVKFVAKKRAFHFWLLGESTCLNICPR